MEPEEKEAYPGVEAPFCSLSGRPKAKAVQLHDILYTLFLDILYTFGFLQCGGWSYGVEEHGG